jgi:hypothetical protein
VNVIEYVTEEVRRQGHDVTQLDGIERVAWMLFAWSYALSHADRKPDLGDVIPLGTKVERCKNSRGYRQCAVRVGIYVCPDCREVSRLLVQMFKHRDDMTPLEFYREFEQIHPFVDGNGRTGKILFNWLNGTLLEPIFPPNDFWGTPILNP